MPKPNVELTEPHLSVAPGERVTTTLRFRNRSPIVGEFRVSIPAHCAASRWVQLRVVHPNQGKPNPLFVNVSFLRDKQEAEVELAFEPPDTANLQSGPSRFVIAIDARDRDNESSSIEGVIDIAGTPAIDTRLFVDRPGGRRAGLYRLGAINTGNTPVEVMLNSTYEPATTSVAWTPNELRLRPRERGEFLVQLKPRNLRPIGKSEKLTATLEPVARTRTGEFPVGTSETLTFEQKPWVPTLALPVMAMAIGGAAFLAWPEPVEEQPENAPDPPSALVGTPGVDTVDVSWEADQRATETNIAVVKCDDWNPLEPGIHGQETFQGVLAGSVPLTAVTFDPFCLVGRSVGSVGTWSKWSEPTAPIPMVSTDINAPQLTIANGQLQFTEVDAQDYQIIVNNVPKETVVGPPFSIADLDLDPGQYAFKVQAIGVDGQRSAPSNEESYIVADESQAPIDRPWVMFAQRREKPSQELLNGLIAVVGLLGGPFADRAEFVDIRQIPETTASGEPIRLRLGDAEEQLGGRWAVGYFGDELTPETARQFCEVLNKKVDERQGDVDTLMAQVTCAAFDGQGQQLTGG